MLTQVLSSFECLSNWNKAEDFYEPGDECKLVNRCPNCGTLTKEKEKKIQEGLKKKTGEEDVRPLHVKKKLKRISRTV